MKKSEERIKKIDQLEQTLKTIAFLGGNLSDDRLTDKTGPNDAVARGILYTGARSIALRALGIKSAEELWEKYRG